MRFITVHEDMKNKQSFINLTAINKLKEVNYKSEAAEF